MSGGKQSTCGTPQGGVISPLLAVGGGVDPRVDGASLLQA
jgi:hypothetical protein